MNTKLHPPCVIRHPAFTILSVTLLTAMSLGFAAYRVSAQNGTPTDCYAADPDDRVYAVAVQTDGKIVLGGLFKHVRGFPRSGIARLNSDGCLDLSFNPGADAGTNEAGVLCLAIQSDGKILVGGYFTNLAGAARSNIGRLNSNGSVDVSFNSRANDWVRCLAVQTNGQILVGGWFTTLGGQPRTYLARLNTNGTLDASFCPVADGGVLSLAVQADQKILVGGAFTKMAGVPQAGLARLNTNGSLDPSLTNGVTHPFGGYVCSLAMATNGQILVGGMFNTLAGQARTNIGRLNSTGALDSSFNPKAIFAGPFGYNGCVERLRVQADGQILVGGAFTLLGGQSRNNIGRLTSTGVVDPDFNPGAGGSFARVECLAVQTNGQIIVGGDFVTLAGQRRDNLGRLLTDGCFDLAFNPPAIAGPVYPPPWGIVLGPSGSGDQIGRAAGAAWYFTNNTVPAGTIAFWGATNGGVRLSFDDNIYAEQEILSYRPDLSNLTNGMAVWAGQTLTPVSLVTVYTRFVLTVTNLATGAALPLFEAGTLRLPTGIGGLALVTNNLLFKAVLRFQASYNVNVGFEPALDFYDTKVMRNPPYPATAYSSFGAGFYHLTNSPAMNRIVRLRPATKAVEVQFQNLPGQSYWLWCSTNLTSWEPVTNATADCYGVVSFVDHASPPSPAFYRVRPPP